MSSTTNLAAVLALASRGWKLFPQHSGTKQPTISKWNTKATDSTKQLAEWLTAWPSANIGVKTGRVSNLMVLDVDGDAGLESLAKLEDKYGAPPETLISKTGRGCHYFFNHPGFKLKLSLKDCAQRLGPGLEIHADGDADAVTVPPSVHENGKVYRWENPETPVADAPAWLLNLLTVEEDVPTPASDSDVLLDGSRNDAMYAEVCDLFKTGASKESILRSALKLNESKCQHPLPEAEVRVIVASVSKTHKPSKAKPSKYSRSSRNPLYWYAFDVHSYFADQHAQTLTATQLGSDATQLHVEFH